MPVENYILAAINSISEGLTQGLELREKRLSREASEARDVQKMELEEEIKRAQLANQELNRMDKQQGREELKSYRDEKLDIARQGMGLKAKEVSSKVSKGAEDQTVDFEKRLTDTEQELRKANEALADIESSTGLKKRNPTTWEAQYNRAKSSVQSLEETRSRLKSKLTKKSLPKKPVSSARYKQVMQFLDEPDITFEDAQNISIDGLSPAEQQGALERLRELQNK